jgi:hypothetical protein
MMRGIGFCLLVAGVALTIGPARADDAPQTPALEHTTAFEKAYAASFYQFDACGDGISGRAFRTALSAKVRQCPFSAETKQRFQGWAAAQRRQSGKVMAKLIEDNGGLPMRLQGMTRSCHEQMESPEYRQVQSRLEDFASGRTGPDGVVGQPCDATEITP